MKWITRDTIGALMQPTPQKRSEALKKCGYTDEDIKDADSMYNALYDVPWRPAIFHYNPFSINDLNNSK